MPCIYMFTSRLLECQQKCIKRKNYMTQEQNLNTMLIKIWNEYEEALCERLFCILGYLIYCNRTHRFAFPIRFKCTKPKWNENNQIYCAQFIVNVIIFCQAKSFLVDDVILHFIAIMVIAISQNMILSWYKCVMGY